MCEPLKGNRGITLVELLIALVISSLIVGAAYRAFIGQQKTYTAQEQVVDLQQNARISINKMMDEIMMAGFGNVTGYLTSGGLSGIANVITSSSANQITIVGGGITPILGSDEAPTTVSLMNGSTLGLNQTTNNILIDQLICIGAESFKVTAINNPDLSPNTDLTLDRAPSVDVTGKTIFKVEAVTYRVAASGDKTYLQRNGEDIVDGIENVQFEYLDVNGNDSKDTPANIRMVRVTLTARTEMADPDYKGGAGGFRRRTIASNIKVRNLGLNP